MTRVFVTRDPLEAQLVRSLLENDGIAAEVQGEMSYALVGEIPFTNDNLPSVWVINDAELKRAQEFMTEYQRGAEQTENNSN